MTCSRCGRPDRGVLINGECMPCTNERADRADVAALRSRLSAAEAERDAARVDGEEAVALLREWRGVRFFEDEDDWNAWIADYRPRVDALLSRPATVGTARAREALAALEHCEAKSGPGGNVARCIDTWQAYRTARLAAEKEAADAAK